VSSIIHIDFETCSTVDLPRVGVFKYVEHPDTDVTCAAYTLPGEREPRTWVPSRAGYTMPVDLRRAVATVDAEIHTWNAGFEDSIFDLLARRHRWARPRSDQLHCTMARAAYWGLPASLEKAGEALAVEETKLIGSRRLMLQMARPRDFDPIDGKPVWWHRTDSQKLDELVDYCRQDVIAERAIARRLKPMPPVERRTWLLDQEMNRRGIHVDLELTEKLGHVVADAALGLRRDLIRVTGGAVRSLNEIKNFSLWLEQQGVKLETMRREPLERLYYTMSDCPARDAIRIRLDGARTSTSKLQTLMEATCSDGTVKGLLRYFGAGRTGRWSGAGGAKVQPQNLPRPVIKDTAAAIRCVLRGATADDLDLVYPESAMTVASSCLRGCFVAPAGYKLVVADFSQIEARVLAALAGQQDVLEIFARNEDVYTYDARQLGSDNRQLGKTTRLGLGYQMGPERFVTTAASYGITLDFDQALRIVVDWRAANRNIVGFWYALDEALRALIAAPPNSECTVGPIRLVKNRKGAVLVYLPSGRPLVYRQLQFIPSNRDQPGMAYLGVSQITKQWGLIKLYGGKCAEHITQATARDTLRDTMLAAADRSIDLRFTNHDEPVALAITKDAPATLDLLLELMRKSPAWLPTLPVWADGFITERYRKG
jgi:DNA polymerase bacteriophage-type